MRRSFHPFLGSFMQKSQHSTHFTKRNIPESPKIATKTKYVHTYMYPGPYFFIYIKKYIIKLQVQVQVKIISELFTFTVYLTYLPGSS